MSKNKLIVFFVLLVSLSFVQSVPQKEAEKKAAAKPNLIVILVDDLGFSDIGCYGSEISTPNLDKMAQGGLRLTQFYNTSRCCPSRAALLTGLYPHQAGVGSMNANLGTPAYQGYLNKQSITIAEGLKTQGYFTALSGKWHIGNEPDQWPSARGFDRTFSLIGGTSNYFYPHPYKLRKDDFFILNGKKLDNYLTEAKPDGYYLTNEITDYALLFLDEARAEKKPFYLHITFNAPHFPLQALPEDIAKYRGKYKKGWDVIRTERYRKLLKLGVIKPEWKLSPRDSLVPAWNQLRATEQDAWDLKMAVFAAMVDRVDQNIGRILDKLKETGADQHTLILFMSDNGASHEYAFPLWKQTEEVTKQVKDLPADNRNSFVTYEYNWANVSNTPFQSFKHWEHEGGISSPFIAYLPGTIKPNSFNHQPAHLIDVQATLFDLAGVKYPKTFEGNTLTPAQGLSLRNVLEGKPWTGHEVLYWEHQGNRAVRQGKWKIVSSYPENRWRLFDLETDRTELNDLSQSNAAKLQELIGLYEKWAPKAGVQEWSTISQQNN
ncbi:arylsulfatase [Rhodocytophaga aerolata]|uniref:Arylsulfatase n=1 Tax=Rhodocytophaga aerolata TaxID=455078 RepID=A0ABT8RGA7_9BACT|nr:arylsulfatase [Rhodocytophaga aerolata]MDO1450178.1 arylsulfatase [Rhodocytophaga aerolata]